jgi:hypothetical protein
MKTSYRIFSTHPFLLAIALFLMLMLITMIGWGISMVCQYNLSYIITENILFLPSLFVVLLFNLWFLTSSILPVIKIDTEAITAYSIFWRRAILWKDLHTVRLLKVGSRYARPGAALSFENTPTAELKPIAVLNKGIRVSTFIIVSARPWQIPKNKAIHRGLYNHQMIAGKYAIAFEYDDAIWQLIKGRVPEKF